MATGRRRTVASVLATCVMALTGPAVVAAQAPSTTAPMLGLPTSARWARARSGWLSTRPRTPSTSPISGSGTVSVLDAATCDGTIAGGCAPVATVTVGTGPGAVAVDPATDTLYVADAGSRTVSVVDGATCDAASAANCTPVATATVGSGPSALAVDSHTHTLYVANAGSGTVSVVGESTCDAASTLNCTPIATATVGTGPDGMAVDQNTGAVYVAQLRAPLRSRFSTARPVTPPPRPVALRSAPRPSAASRKAWPSTRPPARSTWPSTARTRVAASRARQPPSAVGKSQCWTRPRAASPSTAAAHPSPTRGLARNQSTWR